MTKRRSAEEFAKTSWQGLIRVGVAGAVLVLLPFYLALYAVIRQTSPAWALLALITGVLSVGLFVVSREATFLRAAREPLQETAAA